MLGGMISLIVLLALVGFLVYAVTTYIPMPEVFKFGIYALAAVCVIALLMRAFGFPDLPLPKLSR